MIIRARIVEKLSENTVMTELGEVTLTKFLVNDGTKEFKLKVFGDSAKLADCGQFFSALAKTDETEDNCYVVSWDKIRIEW